MNSIKHIAVLTSGGDSPGMNPAIRAVVRTAIYHGLKVTGVQRGYQGLLEKKFTPLKASSVGNILQRGGTFLKTSRSPEFRQKEVRKKAFENLKNYGIDALIVIGGDGSFKGASLLNKEYGLPIVGIPGTIDNDISGTNYSIGFYTAVQTAVEAVDKIRDTASSHERNFLIEVMGRNASAIANYVGICSGAETVLTPDKEVNYQSLVEKIKQGQDRGKKSSIIIVAEGKVAGRSYQIQETLHNQYNVKAHVCILGHTQRGGNPTAQERFWATQMGHEAVMGLLGGYCRHATILLENEVKLNPIETCLHKRNTLTGNFQELIDKLSI